MPRRARGDVSATCPAFIVSLLVAETTGALAASFMTILRLLAHQTRLPGATDNTRYGEGRMLRVSYGVVQGVCILSGQ